MVLSIGRLAVLRFVAQARCSLIFGRLNPCIAEEVHERHFAECPILLAICDFAHMAKPGQARNQVILINHICCVRSRNFPGRTTCVHGGLQRYNRIHGRLFLQLRRTIACVVQAMNSCGTEWNQLPNLGSSQRVA